MAKEERIMMIRPLFLLFIEIVGLQYILDRGGEKKEEGFAQIGYGRFVRKQRPKGSANPSWQL